MDSVSEDAYKELLQSVEEIKQHSQQRIQSLDIEQKKPQSRPPSQPVSRSQAARVEYSAFITNTNPDHSGITTALHSTKERKDISQRTEHVFREREKTNSSVVSSIPSTQHTMFQENRPGRLTPPLAQDLSESLIVNATKDTNTSILESVVTAEQVLLSYDDYDVEKISAKIDHHTSQLKRGIMV